LTAPQYPLHVLTSGQRAGYFNSTATSGGAFGAFGQSASTIGTGMIGLASASSGNSYGVQGESDSTAGIGVFGWAASTTGDTRGIWGMATSSSGTGVSGSCPSPSGTTTGVIGSVSSNASDCAGVYGGAESATGGTTGVWGAVASSSDGAAAMYATALGSAGMTFGVYATTQSSTGYGVYCDGDLAATGNKSFKIDHPLDPANRILNHYCSEGPEPLNVYRGNATLDQRGEAWVDLPSYFESINRDFTYQLTAVGAPAPGLYISATVKDNRFAIGGGQPGMTVSWTVTGVRNDAWARAHGAPVEQDKPESIKGRYLSPSLYNLPPEAGAFFKTRAIPSAAGPAQP
jgi:hypothetical protein